MAGVVLHAPFMSGLRVITPSRLLCCFDVFPNVSRLPRVDAPVFIIHGDRDEVIPIEHGRQLARRTSAGHPHSTWWVRNAGHNDIVAVATREYFDRMRAFVGRVLERGSAASEFAAATGSVSKGGPVLTPRGGEGDYL